MGARYPLAATIAVWVAVSKWSMRANPDGKPDYAATEMLATARRKTFGNSRYLLRFGEYQARAESLRYEWWCEGCPGINAAARHTMRLINNYEAKKRTCH